jgi:hypothetical protein
MHSSNLWQMFRLINSSPKFRAITLARCTKSFTKSLPFAKLANCSWKSKSQMKRGKHRLRLPSRLHSLFQHRLRSKSRSLLLHREEKSWLALLQGLWRKKTKLKFRVFLEPGKGGPLRRPMFWLQLRARQRKHKINKKLHPNLLQSRQHPNSK